MTESLKKIFAEVAGFTKEMYNIRGNYILEVQTDIKKFLELTGDLSNQKMSQGNTTLVLTGLAGSLGIAGALFAKTTPAGTAPLDPRAATNAGFQDSIGQAFKWIGDQLQGNEFLSSSCKTVSQFLQSGTSVSDAWFMASQTKTQAAQTLVERVGISEGQAGKSYADQQVQSMQTAAQRVLDFISKGG